VQIEFLLCLEIEGENMKLLESAPQKGITLNSQLVDLLNIVGNENLTIVEQDRMIDEYLKKLKERQEAYKTAESEGIESKIVFLLGQIFPNISEITRKENEIKAIFLRALSSNSICDSEFMHKELQNIGIDPSLYKEVIIQLRGLDIRAKDGLDRLEDASPKIRLLYKHLFGEDGHTPTYDRVTFDEAGKYSAYVAIDGKTFARERLEKMIDFCESHGMACKINSFMMYCDFPQYYDAFLQGKVEHGEITNDEKRSHLLTSLCNYVRDIGERYGDRIEAVDIFNELIYDPGMTEDGFQEEPTYHERNQGWQGKLSLDDLCVMALVARKSMPNTTFTYNDMNWTNPEKRKAILQILKKMQEKETLLRTEGIEFNGEVIKLGEDERLIDTIGFEAHLMTSQDVGEIDSAFEEVEDEIGLPIEITELDVARTGKNPQSLSEINKQREIFRKISELVQSGKISYLTIWSQGQDLSFWDDKLGRKSYASLLDDSFNESELEPVSVREYIQTYGIRAYIQEMCAAGVGQVKKVFEKMANLRNKFNVTLLPSAESKGEELEDDQARRSNVQEQIRGTSAGNYPQRCQEAEAAWVERKANATLTNGKSNKIEH